MLTAFFEFFHLSFTFVFKMTFDTRESELRHKGDSTLRFNLKATTPTHSNLEHVMEKSATTTDSMQPTAAVVLGV